MTIRKTVETVSGLLFYAFLLLESFQADYQSSCFAALLYCDIDGNESLLVKDVPGCLIPQQKHSGKDILPCSLCGKLTILKDM
jgi:hypothetical protein